MCSSVFYQSVHQKINEEELDFLKKRQRELTDIQEELKNQIFDEKKNIEKLRKKETELKKELKEKEKQLEQEQEKSTCLSEKIDKLEAELKKFRMMRCGRLRRCNRRLTPLHPN